MKIDRLKRLRLAITLFSVGSLLAACGESGEPGAKAPAAGGKLDACKILATANPADIMGEESDAGTLLWERHTDDTSVSQCSFTALNSDRSIGLMVRRESGGSAPASRAAFIATTRGTETMGVGEESAAALEAGKEHPGLGDLALSYDLISFNLIVWSGELQFTVMLDDFGSGEEAEAAAIRVAKAVLSAG